MTYKQTLDWFRSITIDTARNQFIKDGKFNALYQLLVMQGDKQAIVFIPANDFMESDHKKDMLELILVNAIKKFKPIAIAFTSEMWLSEVRGDSKDDLNKKVKKIPMPSKDPQRMEGLIIMMESYNKSSTQIWKIVRDIKDNEVTLENHMTKDWFDTQKEDTGRFNALYKKAGIDFNAYIKTIFSEN